MARPKLAEGGASRSAAFWLGTVPGHALAALACALLFGMMVLTFLDVAGRYLFDSPLPAAHEITSFTMPGIIFCALPIVSWREGHVTIDLMDPFVPTPWRRWQALVVNIVSVIAMAVITWRLAEKSYTHWRFNEATDELYLSLWPFSLFMAILGVIATIALLANVVGYIRGVRTPPAAYREEELRDDAL